MTFRDCPQTVRGLLLLWILLAGYLVVFSVCRMIRQKRPAPVFLLPVGIYLLFRLMWRFLRECYSIGDPYGLTVRDHWIAGHVPIAMLFLLVAAYTVFSVSLFLMTGRWQKNHLTGMSAKESLDALPAGICYYGKSGRVWMVNRRMNEFCRCMTGKRLGNGVLFWELVSGKKAPEGTTILKSGDSPLLQLPDGRVVGFIRYWNEKNAVWEIDAADMTEEIRRAEELEKRKQELEQQRERLHEYSRQMVRLTREREEAEARTRIHDRLNRILFSTLYSLEDRNSDMQPILAQWKENILSLERKEGEKMDPEKELADAAASIGLQLIREGVLPKSNAKRLLLMSAAGECMINAVRHGGAGVFIIRSGEDRLEFENDGKLPDEPVHFGSGLSAIRRKAEQLGASVSVLSENRFCLVIDFTAEGGTGA